MFQGQNLSIRRGGRLIVRGFDFRLEGGELLVLRGPNGSGKTTLLRAMAGLLPVARGTLRFAGEAVGFLDERHGARVHYAGHRDGVKPDLSAARHLDFWAAFLGGRRRAGRDAAVADALVGFGLGDLADLPARFLSEGQRRRLGLARLLLAPRPLWLLDEPTAALDSDGLALLHRALARHRVSGGMTVAAVHGAFEAEAIELALDPAGRRAPGDTWDALG